MIPAMGMGGFMRAGLAAAALAAMAACTPEPQPVANGVDNAAVADEAPAATPAPAVTPPAGAASPLGKWLVGSWSFDTSCATDFVIHYEADGKLDNAGEVGTWTLDGDMVTESVTERFENGGEAPVKLDPPVTRSYAVKQLGANRGTITFQGRAVPIQRC